MAQIPFEVNTSKLGVAIPDEVILDGINLATEAAKRNQKQDGLIYELILASQLAFCSAHPEKKSEAYRARFVTDTPSHDTRLSLSKMEHTRTAICNSLRQVNIGQLLIDQQEILTLVHDTESKAAGVSGVRTLVNPTTYRGRIITTVQVSRRKYWRNK